MVYRELFALTEAESSVPVLSVPTLLLAAGVLISWAAVHAVLLTTMTAMSSGSSSLAVALLTVLSYVSFTPMHDASHSACAARGWRFLNGLVGRAMATVLVAPYPAFKYLHLQHHAHTNDSERDPDLWSGSGPPALRPFRWVTQLYHYYYVYFGGIRTRPWREALETLLTLVLLYGGLGWFAGSGFSSLLGEAAPTAGVNANTNTTTTTMMMTAALPTTLGGVTSGITYVLLYFILPSTLAQTFLAFSFDYLPHRPHDTDDVYKGTAITSLAGSDHATALVRPLSLLLLYQNYHVVHHLFPFLPFYKYADIYYAHQLELQDKGTPVRPLWPIFCQTLTTAGGGEAPATVTTVAPAVAAGGEEKKDK